METVEGNKLIAEFMGYEYYPAPSDFFPNGRMFHSQKKTYDLYDLHYGKSWDWLMPVISKIGETEPPKDSQKAEDLWDDISESLCHVRIDITYIKVLTFIQWYNEQKQPHNNPSGEGSKE